VVSDVLEKNATPEQKEAKIDLADFIAEDIVVSEDSTASAEATSTTAEASPTTVEATPTTAEAAPVANKATQIQKIINNQAEIMEAKNKSPEEKLREMAEDNPVINHLVEAFGLELEDSS
jgi:hypothetical protein